MEKETRSKERYRGDEVEGKERKEVCERDKEIGNEKAGEVEAE